MTDSRPLLAAALSLAMAVPASAAPHGVLWAAGQKPMRAASAAPGGLLYYGGPVMQHAKVYAVFWGDQVAAETKAKIGSFFTNMLDSAYMDWLSEYHTSRTAVDGRVGTNQTIGRGTFMGAVTIRPGNASRRLDDADIQRELVAQIAAGALAKPDDDTLYMLYFPAGVSISIEGMRSCSSFCAYHEGFKDGASSIFYGVMPVCGFGCGSGYDALTAVSSHEAIEAITDPFPTPGSHPAYPQAWNDANGEEITDLCPGSSWLTGHGVTNKVSAQWKNSIGGCYNGPWKTAAASTDLVALLSTRRAPASLPGLSGAEAVCWDGR